MKLKGRGRWLGAGRGGPNLSHKKKWHLGTVVCTVLHQPGTIERKLLFLHLACEVPDVELLLTASPSGHQIKPVSPATVRGTNVTRYVAWYEHAEASIYLPYFRWRWHRRKRLSMDPHLRCFKVVDLSRFDVGSQPPPATCLPATHILYYIEDLLQGSFKGQLILLKISQLHT